MHSMICVIDADSIPYIVANSALSRGKTLEQALKQSDELVEQILTRNNATDYIMIFTGSNNYRHVIDPSYKKFREKYYDKSQSLYYFEVKQYIITKYRAYRCHGAEADDVCCTLHKMINNNNDILANSLSVIASADKDLLQAEGLHYNYSKKIFYHVTQPGKLKEDVKGKVTGVGQAFLYYQMLIGDSSDGIKGIPKIGPKTAYKMLKNCTDVNSYEKIVKDTYQSFYKDKWEYYYNIAKGLLEINTNLVMDIPTVTNFYEI